MQEDKDAVRIIAVYNKLKTGRKNWETYWEYISQYAAPNKSSFIEKRAQGDMTRANQIFDGTAGRAARLLASSIIGAVFTGKWFGLRLRGVDSDSDVWSAWLEEVTETMLAAFEDSNFLVQIGQDIFSMVTFGTSGLSVEQNSDDQIFDKLIFKDNHLSTFVFDEGSDGIPNRIYREIMMSPEAALDRYLDHPLVPTEIIDDFKKKVEMKSHSPLKFVEAIEPTTLLSSADREEGNFKVSLVYATEKKDMFSSYVEDLPMLVSRWDKITGDVYGWSPCMTAMPDILTINEVDRLELGAWEKNILPPKEIVVGTLLNGKLNRGVNGVTIVNRAGAINNIDEPFSFRNSHIKAENVRESIKSAFHEQELILPDRSHDTATEVRIRYDLMQRLLGATFGRIKSEKLQPLINRVFRIMYDGGAFPPIPEDGTQSDIAVEYLSPLAKSQRASEVEATMQLSNWIQQLSAMNPKVMLGFDEHAAGQVLADGLGVPTKVWKDKKAYDAAIEKAQQEAMQQQQQQQQHEKTLKNGEQIEEE
jgi:hypothetical protein